MAGTDFLYKLRNDDVVGGWIERLSKWLEPSMERYVQRIIAGGIPEPKAVKDPIWGMIDLAGREVAVLDSPPMQRLRRIRQLGVSYVTYPTAGYSRFEHALGAMHQAERMLRAIVRRSDKRFHASLEDELSTVRLAALLHDVGHLPFSHLTERYYSSEECGDAELVADVDAIRGTVGAILDVPKPSLSECLSLIVIVAPTFTNFLVNTCGYNEGDAAAASLAIAGRPISALRTFVMQLVTNAIDADKLDYMFRDSHATGVPIGIDLERMLYKLFCVEVEGENVPKGLQRLFGSSERALVLATDLPGHQLAYDLAAARSILFERIYLHHKTRAAERLILDFMARSSLHPIDMLGADDGLFSSYSEHSDDLSIVSLRDRHLPRRVFAMSKQYQLKAAEPDESGKPRPSQTIEESWEDLLDDLTTFRARDELRDQVTEECNRLISLLAVDFLAPDLWLEPPPKPYDLGAAQLVVRRPDTSVVVEPAFPAKAASYTLNPSDTVYAYTTATGGVFIFLHVALETVLARKYRLFLGRDVADHAKVDTTQVEALKRQLELADREFFSFDGRLRPPSAYPRTIDGRARVSAVAQRLSKYQIPGGTVP